MNYFNIDLLYEIKMVDKILSYGGSLKYDKRHYSSDRDYAVRQSDYQKEYTYIRTNTKPFKFVNVSKENHHFLKHSLFAFDYMGFFVAHPADLISIVEEVDAEYGAYLKTLSGRKKNLMSATTSAINSMELERIAPEKLLLTPDDRKLLDCKEMFFMGLKVESANTNYLLSEAKYGKFVLLEV